MTSRIELDRTAIEAYDFDQVPGRATWSWCLMCSLKQPPLKFQREEPKALNENKMLEGRGAIAGNTGNEIEGKTGKKVVSGLNAKHVNMEKQKNK